MKKMTGGKNFIRKENDREKTNDCLSYFFMIFVMLPTFMCIVF